MAITKILYIGDSGTSFPGKHLKQSLEYIVKKEKTGGGRWVSAVNCQPGYAFEQMQETKKLFHKTDKRQGYHIIISFKEGEVTAKTAFEIVGEFVHEYLGKDYEAVYVVHDNTAHLHGHIILNSVSFATGKKYRYEKGDWAKQIQPITNRLCEKYGLSTIEIEEDRAMAHDSYDEWKERKDGKFVWSEMICRDIDACIALANDFDEFLDLLSDKGYEIKQNRHLALRPPGMKRFRRCRYFGEDYTEERIKERIVLENKEHYEKQRVPARIVRVEVPYHIKKAKLSGLQRRYFARLYRLGQLKQRPYSQAWKYREEIKKMHRLHDEYLFLSEYEVHSGEDLLRVSKELEGKKKEIEKQRRIFLKERSAYRELWKKLERVELLAHANDAFLNGDGFFQDEHKEYDRLLGEIKSEGYTPEDLKKLKGSYEEKGAIISGEYKAAKKHCRIAEKLIGDLSRDARQMADRAQEKGVQKEHIKS